MTHWKALSGSAAILLATTSLTHADITGAQVWANWQAAAESMGQALTPGSEDQSGDTLTISDMQITMDMPEGTVEGSIAMVEFTDQADGSVAIAMSPSYDMVISVAPPDEDAVRVVLTINQDGLDMTASGDETEVTYDFTAPALSFAVSELQVDAEPVELLANATLSDVAGKYVVTQGDPSIVTTMLAAANMAINVDMDEPDGGGGNFNMALDYSEMAFESAGSLVMMAQMDNMSAMLAEGMATATSMSHGPATFAVNFDDAPDMFALSGSAETGRFDVALDSDQLAYGFGNTGLDVVFSGSEIPLPEVAFAMGELGFDILMPTTPGDTPEEFGLGLVLGDLSVSDMIWGMLDAGGQLSHDPATLVVDVTGQANWLVDIFDPEAAAMASDIPAQLHALDLNELVLSLAGAELTGTGAFTFDNDDLETFDGIPAPTGAIDLQLVGGNTLLDALVAMGLIPEDQAMGARMMMGLFARPGDGEDTLVSTIEVDGATGAISANGQRLQ